MSADAIERFEMIFAIGVAVITVLAYATLSIICFVISSKKKYKNPEDSKTWRTLGIILVCVGGFALLGVAAAFLVPALMMNMLV